MSYNTRNNYNNRHSGQGGGGGRQGNYNTSGQFVPASSNGLAGAADASLTPLQQRPTRANTITQNNDYAQMYNSSPQQQSNNISQQDVDMKVEPSSGTELPSSGEKPAWMKSKLQGVKKVTNRERRRRQNVSLRRLLSPKNAVMVLNEVLPDQQIANNIRVEPAPAHYYGGQAFAAEITVDGQSFKGYGDNKLAARTKAAEQAFRDLMIKKMTKGFGSEAGSGEEDEASTLPMMQLASFALHKLFAEWEGEGHKVPALRPAHTNGAGESGSHGAPRAAGAAPRPLPANAADMHPAMLLTYMCPRAEYREVSSSGSPPNCAFCMAVSVGNHTFTATAKSKKEARRQAAAAACEALYHVTFNPDAVAAVPVTVSAPRAVPVTVSAPRAVPVTVSAPRAVPGAAPAAGQ